MDGVGVGKQVFYTKIVEEYLTKNFQTPLVDVAVAAVAQEQWAWDKTPRVVIRNSEGYSPDGLVDVLRKIENLSRTETYMTPNIFEPEAIEHFSKLCAQYHVNKTQAQNFFISHQPQPEGFYIYYDMGRMYPAWSDNVRQTLDLQFGRKRVEEALLYAPNLKRILDETNEAASYFERPFASPEEVFCWILNNGADAFKEEMVEKGVVYETDEEAQRAFKEYMKSYSQEIVSRNEEKYRPYQLRTHEIRGIPFITDKDIL